MSKLSKTHSDATISNKKEVLKEANLYNDNNSLQRRDAAEALQEFSSKIKWKSTPKVLDIGCGDGGVTDHILRPLLPENFEKLIGCDISVEMIRFANLHHKKERLEFQVVDIASSNASHIGQFDNIFSFYALHWIQEQEKAMSNIRSMLTDGGDCLFVFLGRIPIYDIYRILAARPIWSEYMYDLDKYISPYHDSERPEDEFRDLMLKCGFTEVEVQCKKKVYFFEGLDVLRRAVRAVNPFNHRLSPALREQFLDDYIEVVRQKDLISESTDKEKDITIKASYSLIVAYAVK